LPARDGSQDAMLARACWRRGVPEPFEAQHEIPHAAPVQDGFQLGFQGASLERAIQSASLEQNETSSALRERWFHYVTPKCEFHYAPPEHEFQAVPQEPWFR
jgi:hypothetical protein